MDVESSGESSDGESKAQKFINPLAKKKTIDAEGEVSEGSWSDDDVSEDEKKKKKKEKKTKLGKRKARESDEDVV